jgi:AraC family chitin signaling transcriptional activator
MKKNRPLKGLLIRGLFLFLPLLILGQELPPIQLFSPSDYNAADQNWDIDQGPGETIYIANNQGLLEYNGARWKLNAIPSQTIVRSVRCIGEQVFTGSYMDFGYWARDPFGQLNYTSLVTEFGVEVQEDEEFWDIIYLEDWVLFQSLDRIYALNLKTKQYEVIVSDTRINDLYVIDKTVYFQQSSKGIYKILNGESVQVLDDPRVVENEVVGMYDEEGKALLILTKEAGFFSI